MFNDVFFLVFYVSFVYVLLILTAKVLLGILHSVNLCTSHFSILYIYISSHDKMPIAVSAFDENIQLFSFVITRLAYSFPQLCDDSDCLLLYKLTVKQGAQCYKLFGHVQCKSSLLDCSYNITIYIIKNLLLMLNKSSNHEVLG